MTVPVPKGMLRLAEDMQRIVALLDRHADAQALEPPPLATDGNAPLNRVATIFDLSPFERDILLLCAGIELDADCAAAVARQAGGRPSFALALAALPGAHWSALLPTSPLRAWRLIECDTSTSVVGSVLKIDERILHLLVGLNYADDRLRGIVEWATPSDPLAPSHRRVADRIAAQLATNGAKHVLQICGGDLPILRHVAAHAAALDGAHLLIVGARDLPEAPDALDRVRCLIDREAMLTDAIVALLVDEPPGADAAFERRIGRFIDGAVGRVMLIGLDRRQASVRTMATFDVCGANEMEQQGMWRRALDDAGVREMPDLRALSLQFDMTEPAIRAATTSALAESDAVAIADSLWDNCRRQARPRLDDLVQRIEPSIGWDALVLPPREQAVLRSLVNQVRHRATVHGDWGFAGGTARGLGIAALFAGPSGTGKTLAAEVIASELRLDLYRIDLSAVVNKYIGETEKNLRRVFDAAEAGGAILLFDEADALFGKRSDVKSSHDRHANIEVGYLLQRLESYRGLSILTSNLRDSIDPAFQRRLRFIVQFPFPDAAVRERIWRGAFPVQAPLDGIDFVQLAQLNVAGGAIRTIALNAAFSAATEARGITMADIRAAARIDYAKSEKTLTEAETRGWP